MSTESFVSVFTAWDWVFVGVCVVMVAAAFVVAFPSSAREYQPRGNQPPRR